MAIFLKLWANLCANWPSYSVQALWSRHVHLFSFEICFDPFQIFLLKIRIHCCQWIRIFVKGAVREGFSSSKPMTFSLNFAAGKSRFHCRAWSLNHGHAPWPTSAPIRIPCVTDRNTKWLKGVNQSSKKRRRRNIPFAFLRCTFYEYL